MIWNRGGKSCMWFCVFIWVRFFIYDLMVLFKWMAKREKNMCNEANKHTLNSTLTSMANTKGIKRKCWFEEWNESGRESSVLGEKSRKREKNVHLKHEMASLHDVAALRNFSVRCSWLCTQHYSRISFRNRKKKYFIYEIMIWHINEASRLKSKTIAEQNRTQPTSTNDAGKMVINLSTIMRAHSMPWYEFWHL